MKTLSIAGQHAGTIAHQAARADAAAWGRALQAAAHHLAGVAAIAFLLGEALGRQVHQLSADLAAVYRCLLVGHQTVAAVTEQVMATWQGLPLTVLSVVELRRVARERLGSAARIGGRRIAQANRAGLLAALA